MQAAEGNQRLVNNFMRRPPTQFPGGRIVYMLLRILVILSVSFVAFVLSVVASVWGLTAVLVGAALIALVALRVVQSTRTPEGAGAVGGHGDRHRRAFVITGVVVIGFFVLLTLASQILVSHY